MDAAKRSRVACNSAGIGNADENDRRARVNESERTAAGAKAVMGLSVLSSRRCFVVPPCNCSSTFMTTELSETLLMLQSDM